MLEFRLLRADEIECRISQVGAWGVQLLLYKDARADMNLMDECVGAENWQRKHEVINGNLFCSVGIRVVREDGSAEWIWRQDVGTESNTEKEKGQSSDSFKRACTCFGAGRELYTSPSMFVKPKDLKKLEEKNGRWTCKDRFEVTDIRYNGRKIQSVQIVNTSTGAILDFGEYTEKPKAPTARTANNKITAEQQRQLVDACKNAGPNLSIEKALEACNKTRIEDISEVQFYSLMQRLQAA